MTSRIGYDLPCERCAYNLRTLPRNGVCPECGLAVDSSESALRLRGAELHRLRLRDAGWLRSMHAGASIACAAALLAMIGLVYGDVPPGAVLGALWLTPLLTIHVVSHWAAWHLARSSRPIVGGIVRALLVVSLTSIGLLFLNSPWARFYHRPLAALGLDPSDQVLRTARALGVLAAWAWPIVTFAACGRLARLAWLARLGKTAVVLGLVGIGATGVTALLTAAVAIAPDTYHGSEIAPLLVGPTATSPMPWIVAGFSIWANRLNPSLGEALFLAILLGLAAAQLAALLWLRWTIGRAIRLGSVGSR